MGSKDGFLCTPLRIQCGASFSSDVDVGLRLHALRGVVRAKVGQKFLIRSEDRAEPTDGLLDFIALFEGEDAVLARGAKLRKHGERDRDNKRNNERNEGAA